MAERGGVSVVVMTSGSPGMSFDKPESQSSRRDPESRPGEILRTIKVPVGFPGGFTENAPQRVEEALERSDMENPRGQGGRGIGVTVCVQLHRRSGLGPRSRLKPSECTRVEISQIGCVRNRRRREDKAREERIRIM
jgi:hypothetical protein